IEVEGALEILAVHELSPVARVWGNEHFGYDARHLHVRGVRDLDGERASGRTKGIGVELRALVPLAYLVHDAEEADGLPVGHSRIDDDMIIELEVAALFDAHPELEGCGVHRPEHEPDGFGASGTRLSHGAPPARRVT